MRLPLSRVVMTSTWAAAFGSAAFSFVARPNRYSVGQDGHLRAEGFPKSFNSRRSQWRSRWRHDESEWRLINIAKNEYVGKCFPKMRRMRSQNR